MKLTARVVAVAAALGAVALVPIGTASAHRSACHTKHACPSDHATYRWRGLLCVKPSAGENDGTFRKKVGYGGLPYLCKN